MLQLRIKKFNELALDELYDILALRTDIFVVEQHCAYPELDYRDQLSHHVMLSKHEHLLGYARVPAPGSVYEETSIGRVAVRKEGRGKGFGRRVFHAALNLAQEQYPGQRIKIQAQCYLENFYAGFGFKTVSAPYPDVGVMHVDMIL